ncbi:hypothetical protein D3C76_1489150 [compost metagenome]
MFVQLHGQRIFLFQHQIGFLDPAREPDRVTLPGDPEQIGADAAHSGVLGITEGVARGAARAINLLARAGRTHTGRCGTVVGVGTDQLPVVQAFAEPIG